MDLRDRAQPVSVAELADEVEATVGRWAEAARALDVADESRLRHMLAGEGADFAVAFVEGVVRPEDPHVAGRNLDRLSRSVPRSLPWYSELGTQFAGGFAPLLPSALVPLARDAFVRTIDHLFVRLDGAALGKRLEALAEQGGIRPVIAPVTAVASGDREAERQATDARELLLRDDVPRILLSPLALAGQPRFLELDRVVDSVIALLDPLGELAAAQGKGIEFEVQRVDELELAVRALLRLAERHPGAAWGIGLPNDLPESLVAVEALLAWAAARDESAPLTVPLTVRLTRGEQTEVQRREAAAAGIPAPTFATRLEAEAQYLRMLDRLLVPSLAGRVRVVAATGDVTLTAAAWRLARRRRVEGSLEHEFRLGMDSGLAAAAKRDLGGIRMVCPVVQPGQWGLAAPLLVRRLREIAGVGAPASDLREALALASEAPPTSFRRFDIVRSGAADPTLPSYREWAASITARATDSGAGEALLARSALANSAELDATIESLVAAGREWGERRGVTRAAVLDSVAEVFAEWRSLLVETALSESGLLLDEADAEVTHAIALTRHLAASARGLDAIRGARFEPARLTVVASPRSGPIATPAAAVLSALAAGSAVFLKTAPETRRSAAVLIETLVAAGVPQGLLALLDDEGPLAEALVRHPSVDRVVLDGSRHTARLFHSWQAELPLLATTGGRNAVVVTPSADLESAVSTIVASAFGHAGQAPTATNTVILVGSVGESARFLGRLRDAVGSLVARSGRTRSSGGGLGAPGIAALARPVAGRVLEALDSLGEGESWLVRPEPLDDSGRSWSPGLRDGVQPDAAFRLRESRAPVLGILRAATLAEAIELQNAPGFGLTAALLSLDHDEIAAWTEAVRAGMLFVNRPVRPHDGEVLPEGGWDRSLVGPGTARGGDAELLALGTWHAVAVEPAASVALDGVSEPVARLIEAALPAMDFDAFGRVRAAVLDDAATRAATLSAASGRERTGLNASVRTLPVAVTIRLSPGAPVADLVRVLAAATLAHAPVTISAAEPLPAGLIDLFGARDRPIEVERVLIESDARWHARVQAGEIETTRIRLLGGDARVLSRVLHGQPRIAIYGGEVTGSGRIESLPFVREQAIRRVAELADANADTSAPAPQLAPRESEPAAH